MIPVIARVDIFKKITINNANNVNHSVKHAYLLLAHARNAQI